uniref:Lysosomal dipeptide transporter MFSD1 n=1 Tax=Oncorhynchus mykiss TaxID=8022 RepID=A0A8C7TN26_ONCMY
MAEERQKLLDEEGGISSSDPRNESGPVKPMSALCDPRQLLHRIFVLLFMCFLGFGSYFCYDNPAALQTQVIQISETKQCVVFGVLSALTRNWLIRTSIGHEAQHIHVHAALCLVLLAQRGALFPGGLPARQGLWNQVIVAVGALLDLFWLMEIGRFVFGIGGESLAVAQNTYAVNWFKGKELNLVFGLQLSMARLGSTVNMNIMGSVYNRVADLVGLTGHTTLGVSLMIAGATCIFSLVCALVLGYLDKRAERILNKEQGGTGEVIKLTDVKDFPFPLWLIFIICVGYYVAIFPFIGLGQVFFIEKFNFSPAEARAINSIVYIISAPASPVLGFMVDRIGKNVIWVLCAVVTTLIAHMMLAFTFWNPWIAMSLLGLSYSLLACALWPMVAFVVPEHQLGTAYGFMQSIQNLGLALISMAAGSILDNKGYLFLEVFFSACVCLALIAVVMLYFVDCLRGGDLNLSASARAKLLKCSNSDSE